MTIQRIRTLGLGLILVSTLVGGCAAQNRPLQLLDGGGPVYPELAREQGLEGEVTVRYDVTDTGVVVNAQVVRSKPAQVFDSAAITTVTSWRFNPARENGQNKAVTGIESTVTFQLNEARAYDNY